MKRYVLVLAILSFLLPSISHASHLGSVLSHYVDDWAGQQNWHLRVYSGGSMRFWDEKYIGDDDGGRFRVRRDWSTPTGYALKGRYEVSGPDGRFTGRMRLYFCNSYDSNLLCGDFIADHLGYRIQLDRFDRF